MALLFSKTLLALRLFIIVLLFLIFVAYFGIPSLQNYLQFKTFFVETKRAIESSDLPVISVTKRTNKTSDIHTKCYNQTEYQRFIKCLTEKTEDPIIDIRENIFFGSNLSLGLKSWERSFMSSWFGSIFLMRQPYNLSNTDFLRLTLTGHGYNVINLHDRNLMVELTEQFKDFQRASVTATKGKRVSIYLDIEQTVLLAGISSCNDDENYSFMSCVKVYNC